MFFDPETLSIARTALQMFAGLAGVLALPMALEKWRDQRASRFQRELDNVRQFVDLLAIDAPNTHPYLIECSYAAITRDAYPEAPTIRFLFSFPSPSCALLLYRSAKRHIELRAGDSGVWMEFKGKMRNPAFRTMGKWFHVSIYAVSAFAALAPLAFAKELFGTNVQVGLMVIPMSLLGFGWIAVNSLMEAGSISRAEKLLAIQSEAKKCTRA